MERQLHPASFIIEAMEPAFNPMLMTSLWILGGLFVAAFAALFIIRSLRKRVDIHQMRQTTSEAGDAPQELPGLWGDVVGEVEGANRKLTRGVFDKSREVFLAYYASGSETPEGLIREYTQDEFLLVVDQDGKLSLPARGVLDEYHKTVRSHPAFGRWFREEVLLEGEWAGTRVLLAARWLCHLVGLRHKTVEIFIDPPDMPGHTLVQVRGMEKFHSPGAFDIPCAGHVDGVDGEEESLRKELEQEINLTLADLEGLRLLERYNSFGEDTPGRANYEHRVLYQAHLKPGAMGKIRFADGEVAGMSVFSVAELRELVRKYPERVAAGLSDAIGYYE